MAGRPTLTILYCFKTPAFISDPAFNRSFKVDILVSILPFSVVSLVREITLFELVMVNSSRFAVGKHVCVLTPRGFLPPRATRTV